MKPMSAFAVEVKELRTGLGMSQKAFSEALGVSYATVNRWEKGHSEPHKVVRDHFEVYRANVLGTMSKPGNIG